MGICTLVPDWAKRLNKASLYAVQLSKKRGERYCELLDSRVSIDGKTVTCAVGEIDI